MGKNPEEFIRKKEIDIKGITETICKLGRSKKGNVRFKQTCMEGTKVKWDRWLLFCLIRIWFLESA